VEVDIQNGCVRPVRVEGGNARDRPRINDPITCSLDFGAQLPDKPRY
jgi:hypothetical protein